MKARTIGVSKPGLVKTRREKHFQKRSRLNKSVFSEE